MHVVQGTATGGTATGKAMGTAMATLMGMDMDMTMVTTAAIQVAITTMDLDTAMDGLVGMVMAIEVLMMHSNVVAPAAA